MKHLAPYGFNDSDALDKLQNSRQATIAKSLDDATKLSLLNQYSKYKPYAINPKTATSKLKKDNPLSSLMVKAYEKPPAAISPLKSFVQNKLSPNICPMCGSQKTGTADHYLPKEEYPDFSFYSFNLVPACDCNTKRGSTLFGDKDEEWIIHPYFEEKLNHRILTVIFTFNDPEPSLNIGMLENSGIPDARVNFHIKVIHKKTTMLEWVKGDWARMREMPLDALSWEINSVITRVDFKSRIKFLRDSNDRFLGTPNSWRSSLLHGIYSCDRAQDLLINKINRDILARANHAP